MISSLSAYRPPIIARLETVRRQELLWYRTVRANQRCSFHIPGVYAAVLVAGNGYFPVLSHTKARIGLRNLRYLHILPFDQSPDAGQRHIVQDLSHLRMLQARDNFEDLQPFPKTLNRLRARSRSNAKSPLFRIEPTMEWRSPRDCCIANALFERERGIVALALAR
jgi:hypothetical protein